MSPLATIHDRYTDEEIKGFYSDGYWLKESLFDMFDAQVVTRPDKVFLFDSTQSFTYAQLRDQALRLALGFRRLGIQKGDRVAVQIPNWAEFGLIALALSRAGAILVPIMPIYRDGEVAYVLQHSGAKAAITCEEFKGFKYLDMFSELKSECPELGTLIAARASDSLDPDVAISLDGLLVDGDLDGIAAELGEGSSPDDGFIIVYTSGTTSKPKGCFHPLNTLRASAAAIARSVNYTEDDVQFGPSPISHSTGLVTSFMLPLIAGASSHLMEAWEPNDALERIEKHGCTAAVSATAFLQMMMGVYDSNKHDASSMRLWICAGAPIPGSVVERSAEMLAGGQILSLYGRSENFLTTMCTVGDPASRSATSDGSALAGADVKIVDAFGHEVERGREGDIAYKGPSHMIEYYQDAEQTNELFTDDGYSRSGDLGVMDADGYVRVTGRLKDIVIRGGLNISARELEDLLIEHPAVESVAVVGMPDERLGEKVCAYVVPADGHSAPTLEELTNFLRERKLATPKLPERLELIDTLPLTATGKIQKHILRADIAQKVN